MEKRVNNNDGHGAYHSQYDTGCEQDKYVFLKFRFNISAHIRISVPYLEVEIQECQVMA